MEIRVGDFLLKAQDAGGLGARKTTIIVCNKIGDEIGIADAHELQMAIMALEATCWRVGGASKSGT